MSWEPTVPVIVAIITFIVGPLVLYWIDRRKLIDANSQLRRDLVNARMSLSLPPMLSSEEYGVKINSPQDYENVRQSFQVYGSFTQLPEGQAIWILTFDVYEGASGEKQRRYWPQEQAHVSITAEGKRWNSVVHNIGGRWMGESKEYLVFVVGVEGQALFDYFKSVGKETGQWPPITQLTTDVVHCATGKVRFTE